MSRCSGPFSGEAYGTAAASTRRPVATEADVATVVEVVNFLHEKLDLLPPTHVHVEGQDDGY